MWMLSVPQSMNDSRSLGCVVKTIKNYVSTCGDVPVSTLIDDYRTSFGCDIPYSKLGYKSLVDFLISISGLAVRKSRDGEYHLQTRWSTSAESPLAAHSTSPDMSSLRVEMKNNLVLLDSAAKRKVTLKSSPLKQSRNPLKRVDSSHSVRSDDYVASSGYCSDNYSTANSSFDFNSSYPRGNDDSAFEAYSPVDENVYSDPTNYDRYDSQWQQPYVFQTWAHDSSATCLDGFGNDYRDPFSEQLSANYDGFASSYAPENCDLDFANQPPPVTHKQVVNRLVALVNAHRQKIASSAVEFQYMDSYSDALPENWLTLLEESNLLFVEHFETSATIYPNRTLPSIPTMVDLPKLDVPGQMPWSVSVTVVRSVDSIWFRLKELDLDRRYQALCQQMRKHYRNLSPTKILFVEEGQLFAAKFDNKLFRVCVLDRQENGACECLAIDEGFSQVLPLTSLTMLHEKFTNTPKLILQGSLAGLRKYVECSHVRERLEQMVVGADTSVVVEKCEAAKFSMNLFVTKADSGSVNVNNYLLDVIENELRSPKLEIDRIFDVVVLSLSIGDRVAKVQIKSPSLELLQRSLRKCARIIDSTDRRLLFAKNLVDVQLNQLYLAKYDDDTWQRILVKQFVDSTHVVVSFVDFQHIRALEIRKIICYANFPDALTYIPPQGVTANIVKTDPEILKLMNLKLETNSFSMKIVQTEPKLYVQMYLKVPREACDEDFSSANFKQFRCTAV